MVLTDPFWVYGTVTDEGVAVENADIYIQDTTTGSIILTEITPANGRYIIDIQSIADDGDTIKVWAFKTTNRKTFSVSFILDVTGPNQLEDLMVVGGGCYFILATDINTWTLTMPETLAYSDGRIINILNLWNDSFVYDGGKSSETIMLSGYETDKNYLTIMDNAVDDGKEITLSGFNNADIDATWLAESFTYGKSEPGVYFYSIQFEKVR